MSSPILWIKENKLSAFLAAVLLFLIIRAILPDGMSPRPLTLSGAASPQYMESDAGSGVVKRSSIGIMPPVSPEYAPSDRAERMVQRDTSLSLAVKDVADAITQIDRAAQSVGGYLIDSSLSTPEGASSGNISIRVPAEKRTEVLSTIKSFGVKVVSEYISGQDITDQYEDTTERLRILESTKVKFETILAEAKNVNEMLSVQQQLINIQQQIDSLKGQQKYLEGSAKLTRISVYLATDELALPYTPNYSWRPRVIAKEALRSLILNVRGIGTMLIWAGVYAPVWLTAIVVLVIAKKKMSR